MQAFKLTGPKTTTFYIDAIELDSVEGANFVSNGGFEDDGAVVG